MRIIGIDPDSNKSGVAILNNNTKELQILSLTFFGLFDILSSTKNETLTIKIEAGWLNKKPNYHLSKSKAIAGKIGNDVGRNAETGRKIIEMCEYLNVPYKVVKPLKKIWKTPTGKISHQQLVNLLKQKNITLKNNKTNQDQRDAILIALLG